MKSAVQKVLVLFFAAIVLNFFGCVTHRSSDNQSLSENDAKALQDSMQQMNSSVQPTPQDVVEGPVPPETKNITMYYYVQSGDNLSKIAKRIYGTNSAWKKLAAMNNLKDPNHIFAGDFIHYELEQSSKAFTDAYENAPKAKVIVKKGDTLSSVAKAVFGKVSDWRVLWKENPQIKNPDKLKVGQVVYFRPKALKMQDASTNNNIIEKAVSQVQQDSTATPSQTAIAPAAENNTEKTQLQ